MENTIIVYLFSLKDYYTHSFSILIIQPEHTWFNPQMSVRYKNTGDSCSTAVPRTKIKVKGSGATTQTSFTPLHEFHKSFTLIKEKFVLMTLTFTKPATLF